MATHAQIEVRNLFHVKGRAAVAIGPSELRAVLRPGTLLRREEATPGDGID